MKLKCTIGSISCDGVLAEKGDIFEVGDVPGENLIKSGYAILEEEPTPPELEPEPEDSDDIIGSKRFDGDITDEPVPSTEAMVDLATLNKQNTLELVKSTDDPDVIQAFLEQEQTGKNRQDVIDALESKLQT